MALQKEITTDEGATASYWRVNPSTSVDVVEGKTRGRLECFLSKDARTAGKTPVLELSVPLTADVDTTKADQRPALYTAAKALDQFKDAKDV